MVERKRGRKRSTDSRPPSAGSRRATRTRRLLIVLAVTATCVVGWWRYAGRSEAPASPSTAATFQPTLENARVAPGDAPQGMVWIPGGEFSMGAAESPGMNMVGMQATTDSRPIHRVSVDGFWMDTTEVTNAQFAKFVEATGYVTIAERTPRAEDFPGAPPENLVAGAVVFSPPDHPVPLNDHLQWWSYVKRANWRHPEGPDSSITGREQYPVVQVAYDDAVAFATWAGKRLPTEAEWEFAARGGLSGKMYPWGDEFMPGAKVMANTHQGHFPNEDTGEDGYRGIGPVARFPPNGYGLYDVAGNVWEWVSDWYRPDYYAQLASTGASRATHKAPTRRSTRVSRPRRSACTGAGRSSAPTRTAHATWWARGARARAVRARITWASASSRCADRPEDCLVTTAAITFICTFGSALAAMLIRRWLPQAHLSKESQDVVRLALGLVATMTALLLGLVTASAKSTFDLHDAAIRNSAANILTLDRDLARYGPETKPTRELLRQAVAFRVKALWPENGAGDSDLNGSPTTPPVEEIENEILRLSPENDTQRWLKSGALTLSQEVVKTEWRVLEAAAGTIPGPFLVAVIFWLSVTFASFGLFAPRNATVVFALFIAAVSVAAAIFLVLELDSPFDGIIRISSDPLRFALEHLNR